MRRVLIAASVRIIGTENRCGCIVRLPGTTDRITRGIVLDTIVRTEDPRMETLGRLLQITEKDLTCSDLDVIQTASTNVHKTIGRLARNVAKASAKGMMASVPTIVVEADNSSFFHYGFIK